MSLYEYCVPRDKFKVDDKIEGFGFPCNVCKYRNRDDDDEPCLHCDYNVESDPDGG